MPAAYSGQSLIAPYGSNALAAQIGAQERLASKLALYLRDGGASARGITAPPGCANVAMVAQPTFAGVLGASAGVVAVRRFVALRILAGVIFLVAYLRQSARIACAGGAVAGPVAQLFAVAE